MNKAGIEPLSSDQVPLRVLDLGCSLYAHAILEMSMRKGWEHTTFVGTFFLCSAVKTLI